ncbi:MAG: diacylglycerol kinase [Bacilli bacterium]|nr:diacylglycerol kinase [Bacilli bacterium]
MSTVSKDKKKKLKSKKEVSPKKYGFKRFIASWVNSYYGYKYAYTHEQSLLLHIFFSIFAIFCGIVFEITGTQWILLFLVMTVIIVAELLNTAIEATVDLVTEEYHPLAKVAKDCASAAVLTSVLLATIVGIYVFFPQILELIFKR